MSGNELLAVELSGCGRGGERSGCDADAGVDASGCSSVFAPAFTDFVGRPWEATYPYVLAAYYGACRGVVFRGDGGGSRFGHVDGVGGGCCESGGFERCLDALVSAADRCAGAVRPAAFDVSSDSRSVDVVRDAVDNVGSGVGVVGAAAVTSRAFVEAGVGESESVGKQHFKNVRKRERAKAKKLVVRSDAEVVREETSSGGRDTSGSVRLGVSCAAIVSGGAAAPVGQSDDSGCVFGSVEKGAAEDFSSLSGRGPGGVGFQRGDLESATTVVERRELARQWFDRKRTENELSIQRNKYNIKRNAYLDRARISEKKWEQERLICEQKLAKITEARFGSKPGYAETLASLSDGSERPPSLSTDGSSPANLSDGTISPDSSMSVAEANKLLKKVEEVSERLVKLELENKSLRSLTVFKGGHVEEENGKFHSFDGTGQYVPPTPELGSECELYSMGDYPEYCEF